MRFGHNMAYIPTGGKIALFIDIKQPREFKIQAFTPTRNFDQDSIP